MGACYNCLFFILVISIYYFSFSIFSVTMMHCLRLRKFLQHTFLNLVVQESCCNDQTRTTLFYSKMCQAHKYSKIEIENNRKQWITLMAAVQYLQEWFCATTVYSHIL